MTEASSVDPSKYLKCQQKLCDLVLELKLNVDENTKVKILIQGQKTKEYKQENISKGYMSDWEKDRLKWEERKQWCLRKKEVRIGEGSQNCCKCYVKDKQIAKIKNILLDVATTLHLP